MNLKKKLALKKIGYEFTDLEKELNEKTVDVTTKDENLPFAVNIPRWRHREPACGPGWIIGGFPSARG